MSKRVFVFMPPEQECIEVESLNEPEDYWETFFVGKSMEDTWQRPEIRIHGASSRDCNFAFWTPEAPVVSEDGCAALQDLLTGAVECLPLVEVNKRQFFALNVLLVEGLLDHLKSDIQDDKFVFRNIIQFPAEIFKIPENPAFVFVTEQFVDAVHERGLGRLSLSPAEEGFRLRFVRSLRH